MKDLIRIFIFVLFYGLTCSANAGVIEVDFENLEETSDQKYLLVDGAVDKEELDQFSISSIKNIFSSLYKLTIKSPSTDTTPVFDRLFGHTQLSIKVLDHSLLSTTYDLIVLVTDDALWEINYGAVGFGHPQDRLYFF